MITTERYGRLYFHTFFYYQLINKYNYQAIRQFKTPFCYRGRMSQSLLIDNCE